MDLLFNQEKKFYNSTLADLETSYHLLTNIYYKNSLNLTMSLVTKYRISSNKRPGGECIFKIRGVY